MKKITLAFAALALNSLVFAEPHPYPVPFTPSRNAAHTAITFTDLAGDGRIRIYTIDGKLVNEIGIAQGQLTVDWPATNSKGEKVATGVYIYNIETGGSSTQGKLVVIR